MFTLSPEVLHQHQDVNRGVHRGIEDLRPSGEAVSGTSTLPALRATVADLRVAKSKH